MTRRYGDVSFGGRSNGPSALSAGKPAAQFPAAVVNDQHLAIAVDRIQTSLAASMGAADVTMTVQSAAGIAANMLLSIDSEIVQTTGAPAGTLVPVSRGFDGTTAAVHSSNAVVSGYVDAYHHNTLVAEIEAIEQALGPNLSGLPGNPGYIVSTPYNWPAQTPGVSIGTGAQTFSLAPVPKGVNGGNIGQMLYISGGTGAAEAAPIIGGNAVAGQPSGTVIVTTASAHSGAWTVQSASSGIQEAIIDAGPGKLIFIPAGAYTIQGGAVMPYDNQRIAGAGRDETVLTAANGSNLRRFFLIGANQNIAFERLGFNGNFVNQTYPSATVCCGIDGSASRWTRVFSCKFAAFGNLTAADAPYSQCLSFYSASHILVDGCYFESNFAAEGAFNACNDVRLTNNVLGSPYLTDSNANVLWWDNKSGGMGFSLVNCNDVYASGNQMSGCRRAYNLSTDVVTANGTFLGGYSGGGQMSGCDYIDNNFMGLGNGLGTISVTSGGTGITGVNTQFHSLHVGTFLIVEGDNSTPHTITARTSNTSITVSPAIARSSASGLRYQCTYSGDVITVANTLRFTVKGNVVRYSGDVSYDIAVYSAGSAGNGIFCNNYSEFAAVEGLVIIGFNLGMVNITGNVFKNNCLQGAAAHHGAIDITQTGSGPVWHLSFNDNLFVDDQAVTTQLAAYQLNGTKSSISGCSESNSHLFGYATAMTLYDSATTSTQWGASFNTTLTSGIRRINPIAFASLGTIDVGAITPGTMVYCADAKSISDGAAAGSTAVGGGTGTLLQYINGNWKVI